jgi:tRNA(Ile2) C34 agmatinyltransferase TiaS
MHALSGIQTLDPSNRASYRTATATDKKYIFENKMCNLYSSHKSIYIVATSQFTD